MNMRLVVNVLLVEVICIDLLLSMCCLEQPEEVRLELVGILVDVFPWILADL